MWEIKRLEIGAIAAMRHDDSHRGGATQSHHLTVAQSPNLQSPNLQSLAYRVPAAARSMTCAAFSCVTKPGPVISTGLAIVFRFSLKRVSMTIGM